MKILNTTTPHYTRCIKPNRGCRPLTFKKKEVFYPIRLCPLLTKNVSFYRCFLFFSFLFYFFCKVLMQLTACGIVETIHISAAGFPIRYKILCFLFWCFLLLFLCVLLTRHFCHYFCSAEFLSEASYGVMDWGQNIQVSGFFCCVPQCQILASRQRSNIHQTTFSLCSLFVLLFLLTPF